MIFWSFRNFLAGLDDCSKYAIFPRFSIKIRKKILQKYWKIWKSQIWKNYSITNYYTTNVIKHSKLSDFVVIVLYTTKFYPLYYGINLGCADIERE